MTKKLLINLDDAVDHFSTKNNHYETFLPENKKAVLDELAADFRKVLEALTVEVDSDTEDDDV